MVFGTKKAKEPAEWAVQAQAFEKILGDCAATGSVSGGVSSGVRRLIIKEQRGAQKWMPSKGHISGSVEQGPGGDETMKFDFFLRGGPEQAAATMAVTELYRRVSSAVCTTPQYRTRARGWVSGKISAPRMGAHRGGSAPEAGVPRVHVPKLYASVDRTMGGAFNRALAAVDSKFPNWWKGAVEGGKNWSAMSIVQGVKCKSLQDWCLSGKLPASFNFRGHASALGVIHALDVIFGNADRVQKPNIGNIFSDEGGTILAIDCDTMLPEKVGGKDAEWTAIVCNAERGKALSQAMEATWPNLPYEISLFAPYMQNAARALTADFDHLISTCASFKDPVLNVYVDRMRGCGKSFSDSAIDTFRQLKSMKTEITKLPFPKDQLCFSRSTLLEKIKNVSA